MGELLTRREAEDYIYSSYMKAQPYLGYDTPDSIRRHPEYTGEIIKSLEHGALSVAVTGSKGKGSAAYILQSILSAKERTGLMTSPHILSFNERFRTDGDLISDEEFSTIVSRLKPRFDDISPDPVKGLFISPIGIETAVALDFFARRGTNIDIFEHGKGVRYDDVRNVRADYALINTIFLEHTRELGSSTEEIARDKASIIRPGMKCVYAAKQSSEVLEIIERAAAEAEVPLKLYGRDFRAFDIRYDPPGMICSVDTGRRILKDIRISLMGSSQCRNLALALAAAEDILGTEDNPDLRERLDNLSWFGRLTVIRTDPMMLVDCCINRTSAGIALETLKELGIESADIILAIPDDKDYKGVALASHEAGHRIILTKVKNPHYRFAGIQQEELAGMGLPFTNEEELKEALKKASRPTALLGTTAMLREVREYMERNTAG